MTIREALRKLYTAMCGGTTNKNTAGDLINAIATDYTGGGGSSLPPAGADGNVLTADDGEWVSAAPQGDVYAVNLTKIADTFTAYHNGAEIGIADIITAINAGKLIDLTFVNGSEEMPVKCALTAYLSSDDALAFSGAYNDPDKYFTDGRGQYFVNLLANISDDEDVWIDKTVYIPNPSASANGKILGVDDGEYTLVDPSALSNAPLIVHGTISNGDFSFADTTVKDVYDAKVADRAVFLDTTDGAREDRWDLTGAVYDSDTSLYSISFGCLKHGMTKIVAAIIGSTGAASTTTGGGVIESDLTPNV